MGGGLYLIFVLEYVYSNTESFVIIQIYLEVLCIVFFNTDFRENLCMVHE